MNQLVIGALFAGGAFLGILTMVELGRRHRRSLIARGGDVDATVGLGAVEGAVFALMGLLIAFTFSGAAARFDTRRAEIIDEANDLGTAYLRFDLLPATARADLRSGFGATSTRGWTSTGSSSVRRRRTPSSTRRRTWRAGCGATRSRGVARRRTPPARCCCCPR